MRPIRADLMSNVMGGTWVQGDPDVIIKGVAVDSRHVVPGDLFFAMIGEAADGHDYIHQAVANGASGLVVSRLLADVSFPNQLLVIRVDNTHYALWDWANYYLHTIGPTVIGITGSVGKTTTKDMIASVLATRFSVLKNQGNLNTEIGMPMTILNLEDHHQIAVLEMAMRGIGQIAQLAEIAEPKIGVITNIGETHIELLGTVENIAKAKGELLDALPSDGVAILNGDDPWCRKLAETTRCPVYFFSASGEGDVVAENIINYKEDGFAFTVVSGERRFDVQVPLPGLHNVANALAAATCGMVLGVEPDEITAGLARFVPSKMRMQITRRPDFILIDDAYNANPRSMGAALDVLMDVGSNLRKVAVLGDMLELGNREIDGHKEIGVRVADHDIDLLITVGRRARLIAAAASDMGMADDRIICVDHNQDAFHEIKERIKPGDVILVKGSRGMGMEEIIAAVQNLPPVIEGGK